MNEVIKSYKYKADNKGLAIFPCSFLLISLICFHAAIVNPRIYSLKGIVILTPLSVFLIGCYLIVFSIIFFYLLYRRARLSHEITILSDAIVLPKWLWSSKTYRIPYHNIDDFDNIGFAIYIYTGKERYFIHKSNLPDEKGLEEIFDILFQKAAKKRQ